MNTAALNRKVGAHRAREPVTNATAVKPSVDSRKLWLQRKQTRLHRSRPPVTSHVNHYSLHEEDCWMKAVTQRGGCFLVFSHRILFSKATTRSIFLSATEGINQ